MRALFALALLAGAVAGAPSETAAVTCEDARSACQSACVSAGATSAQFFCQETDAGVLQQCACGPTVRAWSGTPATSRHARAPTARGPRCARPRLPGTVLAAWRGSGTLPAWAGEARESFFRKVAFFCF